MPECSALIFSKSLSDFPAVIGARGSCVISSSRNLMDWFLLHPEIVIAAAAIEIALMCRQIISLAQSFFTLDFQN